MKRKHARCKGHKRFIPTGRIVGAQMQSPIIGNIPVLGSAIKDIVSVETREITFRGSIRSCKNLIRLCKSRNVTIDVIQIIEQSEEIEFLETRCFTGTIKYQICGKELSLSVVCTSRNVINWEYLISSHVGTMGSGQTSNDLIRKKKTTIQEKTIPQIDLTQSGKEAPFIKNGKEKKKKRYSLDEFSIREYRESANSIPHTIVAQLEEQWIHSYYRIASHWRE